MPILLIISAGFVLNFTLHYITYIKYNFHLANATMKHLYAIIERLLNLSLSSI